MRYVSWYRVSPNAYDLPGRSQFGRDMYFFTSLLMQKTQQLHRDWRRGPVCVRPCRLNTVTAAVVNVFDVRYPHSKNGLQGRRRKRIATRSISIYVGPEHQPKNTPHSHKTAQTNEFTPMHAESEGAHPPPPIQYHMCATLTGVANTIRNMKENPYMIRPKTTGVSPLLHPALSTETTAGSHRSIPHHHRVRQMG